MEQSAVEKDVVKNDDTSQAEIAIGVVQDILAGCGAEAEVSFTQDEREIQIDVSGENLGPVIGRKAATLDSIQLLAYLISVKSVPSGERRRVIVDVDEYRAGREEELLDAADKAVEEIKETGNSLELAPMSSNDRRVIHNYLAENDEVETESTGDGDNRRVVISPAA
ncbi:MAG: KH domain-containing protein [Thermoleophilaceae bacterium]|nr:KH domain-containing protein [Thermoleophilaceae bacterium]